ncbi:MAG: hypothetical protein KBT04_04850 [Bacteroidales bacterium]|nr:hypothetical protein [Candidatus Colimorpha onthohippi]
MNKLSLVLLSVLLVCCVSVAEAQYTTDSVDMDRSNMIEQIQSLRVSLDSVKKVNQQYESILHEKDSLVLELRKATEERDRMLEEIEQLHQKSLSASEVDKVKLQAQIETRNANIDASRREIEFLQRELSSREKSIESKQDEYKTVLAERDRYLYVIDSLRRITTQVQMENIRKEEQNKYLEQRAKEAEAHSKEATNRKKKVRPIQGVAMRFYRTPNYEIRISQVASTGEWTKVIRNRNDGAVEFDFTTGASVMLWDLSKYFNKSHPIMIKDSLGRSKTIRKFDQEFAYDLGIYAGFGGSNLFKNFYLGASFRFVDFFYLIMGVNIAEYENLVSGYEEGDLIPSQYGIDDITSKIWRITPYVGLSIDLDFLTYVKK